MRLFKSSVYSEFVRLLPLGTMYSGVLTSFGVAGLSLVSSSIFNKSYNFWYLSRDKKNLFSSFCGEIQKISFIFFLDSEGITLQLVKKDCGTNKWNFGRRLKINRRLFLNVFISFSLSSILFFNSSIPFSKDNFSSKSPWSFSSWFSWTELFSCSSQLLFPV